MTAVLSARRSAYLPSESRLGVWRLLRWQAAVPSGDWWLAEHHLSRTPVQLLLYADAADAGAVLLRMSQSAGEALQDPGLLWPLDAGLSSEGRPYLVVPAQPGEPLFGALVRASLRRRLRWLRQLVDLLQRARTQGLTLVELDPSLLWLDEERLRVRLVGLGLVGEESVDQRLGGLHALVGRAAQALQGEGIATQGGEAEVALLLTGLLYFLLSGRPTAGRSPDALRAELDAKWVSLSVGERQRLDELLDTLLAPEAAQGPHPLRDMAEVLDAWLRAAAAETSPSRMESTPATDAAEAAEAAEVAEAQADWDEAMAEPPPLPATAAELEPEDGGLLLRHLQRALWLLGGAGLLVALMLAKSAWR